MGILTLSEKIYWGVFYMHRKTAVITGGGSGFGREVALQLAKKGTNLSIVDISEENGEEAVRLCKESGSDAIFIQADVSKVEDVKRYVAQTVEYFGKIDLFFNNAGISGSGVRTVECSIEEFNAIVDVNLKGVFYGLKFVISEMLKTGGGVMRRSNCKYCFTGRIGWNTYPGRIFSNKTCCYWAYKGYCRRVWKGKYQN